MSLVSNPPGTESSVKRIVDALEVQFRVLNALILRETKTRYGRHKLGFFWIFIEPMFFVGLFLSFKLLLKSPTSGGMSDAYFIITGITPFLLFRQTMSQLANSIAGSRNLLAFPQVTTFDVMLATALLEFASVIFVFSVLVIGFALVDEPPRVEHPLLVLYGTLLLGVTGTGMGMIFASLIPIWPSIKNITNPLFGRPLFFTSGIFFTAEMLPAAARDVVLWNPLLHMVEIIRSAFFIEFESQYIEWNYAGFFAAGVFLFGLLMHQVLRNQAIKLA
ncbi:MAG: ABC transporter permease [Granulosicoccus sp.]|nr:ABC transporter permease [Granulosicoccus sp.]